MIKKHGIKYSVRRYSNLEKGFTQIPNDIFRIVESSYQLTVYTYLCYRYNRKYQYAFPSLKTIAEDTHVSVSTVRRVIKELEDLRLIKILKFDKKNTSYANNMYYVYYPVIDYESSQKAIEDENNLFLSEEQLAELEEIENGVYETKDKDDKKED
jgi:DNA-binding transcriptional regulator YhcF (GntR family)